MMPSIITKPMNIGVENGMLCISISATAHAVIFMHEPLMWMVAQRGTVKPATSSRTPILMAWRSVTGIVAAELLVPKAVK